MLRTDYNDEKEFQHLGVPEWEFVNEIKIYVNLVFFLTQSIFYV
jgi:hypothetical protein